jgi:Putative peptidoglycan binding domain
MSRSSWAAVVGASVFAFALTPAAALAASPGTAAASPARPPAKQDRNSGPTVDRVVGVPAPALAHPSRRPAVRHAASRRAAPRHVQVLLALGSGYQQAAGRVRALQRGLARVGDAPGPIDGRYGPLTTQAVIRFQASQGLHVDGIAGPQTLTQLRVIVSARSPRLVYARPSTPSALPLTPQSPVVTTTLPRPVAIPPGSDDWYVFWSTLAGLVAAGGLLGGVVARRSRVLPRRRRYISPHTLPIARLAGFRYCRQREAYVLRLVGDRFGPVLKTTPSDLRQPPPRHRSPHTPRLTIVRSNWRRFQRRAPS